MNAKTRTFVTLVAVTLSFGLFPHLRSTSAQTASGNCLKVSGKSTDVFNGAGVNTTFTNAGILNGSGEFIFDFNSGFLPTPDPSAFTYLGERTINTQQGQLKLRAVSLDKVGASYIHTEISHINPETSTGRFAGATGVIFFRAESSDGGFNFVGELTGEICSGSN